MDFKLKILDNDKSIVDKINTAFLNEIKSRLPKVYKKCKTYFQSRVIEGIRSEPTYQSLLSGDLNHQFGLINASSKLQSILKAIEDSVVVSYKQPQLRSSGIIGGFTINMIPSDFSDLLSLSAAVQKTEKNISLEWLNWLLLQGDRTIISGYEFSIKGNKKSRSGLGVMTGSVSGSWSVPAKYAGNIDNNWIIKGINLVEQDLENFFFQSLKNM